MVNRFRSRKPFYPDDSDYNTNAPSYYDDLARKQKLIKLLAERIWEYEKELEKRFEAWDKNLEEFDDEVIKLLNEWLADGVLHEVINHDLLDTKAEIIVSEFEPSNPKKETYWFKDMGTPSLEIGGTTILNTNVQVSDDEPTDPDKNVWFDT